jgi:hypothetical protein
VQSEQLAFPGMNAEDEFSAYHDTSKFGYFSVLHDTGRTNSRGYPIKQQESFLLRDMPDVLKHWRGTSNSWISQAEFKKPNRRAVNVLRIGLSFIDLDYYKIDSLRGKTPDYVLSQVFARCVERQIPLPNLVVYSGRGLQVKWLYGHTLPRQALIRWNRLQSTLIETFKDLGADPAARDVSRVLRIVDTYNSKSRQIVEVIHHDQQNRYQFDAMCDQVFEYTREEIKAFRQEAKARKQERQFKLIEGGRNTTGLRSFSGNQLAWDRLHDLRMLTNLRGGVSEGERMKTLFWQLNFLLLSGATNPRELYLEAQQLALQLDQNWRMDPGDLSTLYQKSKQHANGETVVVNGQEYPALYTPRNDTLIDCFEISQEEQKLLRTIISPDEAKGRHRARDEKRRRELGAATREEYEANSLSAKQPWGKLGISRRTWYRKGCPDAS